MKQSLRSSLAKSMTAIFLGAIFALGAIAFLTARTSLASLADQFIQQTSDSIDVRVQTLLEKAESGAKFTAGLVSPQVGGRPAVTNSDRFSLVVSDLLEFIATNQEFSSVSFTLDRTGETVRVVQLTSGLRVVQTFRLVQQGYQAHEFVPFGDQLQKRPLDAVWNDDNRKTDWYAYAKATSKDYWTGTRPLRSGGDSTTPGITLARPVFDRNHRLLGVVSVVYTTTDLSLFIDKVEVGTNGYAAIVESSPGQPTRVVAHPHKNLLLISYKGTERLATLEELGDPVLLSLKDELSANSVSSLSADEVSRRSVNAGQRAYAIGLKRIGGTNRPKWYLAIVIPDEEFMGNIWKSGLLLFWVAAAACVAVAGLSVYVASRVSRPLQGLAQETSLIQSLNLLARKPIESDIREIDELAQGMERMKSGLRSLEKLVPGDYARYLIGTGQEARLGGERRRITVYFGDIVGFTSISERMEPEQLVEVLAEYLDVLSGEVLAHEGTVDKFNGDDVMAFWGAPNLIADHAVRACKAALDSQTRIEGMHSEWTEKGHPLLRASFGISTGEVIVGNVGSRQRMNYTVIGDAVNLASRFQSLNKYYSTEILIGEQTVVDAGDAIVTRMVDLVAVAGRDEPVKVYELMGMIDDLTDSQIAVADLHDKAMSYFLNREFRSASHMFQEVLEVWPHDGPARILLARSQHYEADPPPKDWDGSSTMSVK
ncbi:MAG: adenylate/guanylate cyclase domain-containing protein [Chthonomonadaceae bacterium]|nr:adenylate/guanylate cyclase domain-containing protein [Chthonomonadaceae bacterium]